MKKTIITITTLVALMSTPALVSAAEASAGDKAKAGLSSAADWTVSTSKSLWNTTKQGAEDFTAWNKEKQKHKAPAKWTRVKTDNGWKVVKNKSAI